jgi:hypothetical protein
MTTPSPTPSSTERARRATGLVAALGLAAGVIVAAARRLGDFDLPWHLALGRATVATHRLPLVDDFSYTFNGKRAADEPISDFVLYLAARLGGALGLQILAALAIALIAWLLIRRARPARWPVGCAFAALGLMTAGPWLIVRPALLAFVCLAAFLAILDGRARLWTLVPLQLAWSNVHGFAVLGPLFALAFAGHTLVCRLLAGRGGALFPAADGRHAVIAIVVALAVAAVACVSPLGWHLYLDPFAITSYQTMITEWAHSTLGFVVRYDLPLVVLGLLAIAALVIGPARPSAFDILVLVIAAALAMAAVRLIAPAAIIAAPLVARRLAPRLATARLLPLIIACFGLAAAPVIAAVPGMQYGIGFDERNLPEGAARFIAAQHPRGALFNFLPFGGWLTWRLYPELRVFIDGRTSHLYPLAFAERYAAAEHDPASFAAVAADYDVQWAVVRARPGERFSEPIAHDRRFVMVYLDDCAAIYVRRDGPNAELAANGYRLLRHLTLPPTEPVPPAFRAALIHDAALAVTQDPRSPRARAFATAADALPGS